MTPRWLILVLMLAMNTSMSLLTFHAFKDGTTGAIVCNVIGAVAANALAFLGMPLASSGNQGALPLPPEQK
jgi:hypothetical protein